jgi:hypothetical protein
LSYNANLSPDDQIEAEEAIAAAIFDGLDERPSEDEAAELGRTVLLLVLERFRPDLLSVEQQV